MSKWVGCGMGCTNYFNDSGRRLGHVEDISNGVYAAYVNRAWIADYDGFIPAKKRVEEETVSESYTDAMKLSNQQ